MTFSLYNRFRQLEKVRVDKDALEGYLGASSTDGVLRTGAPLTYTDGGNYITLDLDETAVDHDILTNSGGNQHIDWTDASDNLKTTGTLTSDSLILNKTSGKGIQVDVETPSFGWRDLLGDVFARNTGGSKPSFTTYRDSLLDYQFGVGDEEYFKFHIPHDYVEGTDIFFHIHWSHTSADVTGGTVTFEYEISYAKGHNQAAFGASVGTTFNGTAATGAGGQYRHIITEVQISAGTPDGNQIDSDDLEPDGVIIARLDLNANNMTGATPDPFVHYVDIHYQSTNIGTKDKIPDFYA